VDSLRHEGASIHVVVQDDGVGMPEVALPHDGDSYLHFGLCHIRDQGLGLEGTFQVANGEEARGALQFSFTMPRSE
jgi:nitrate/nitrite-specific signal transduction histidine kinase